MPGNATIHWLAVPIFMAQALIVTTGQTAAPAPVRAALAQGVAPVVISNAIRLHSLNGLSADVARAAARLI